MKPIRNAECCYTCEFMIGCYAWGECSKRPKKDEDIAEREFETVGWHQICDDYKRNTGELKEKPY